jgi:hypothetical protein
MMSYMLICLRRQIVLDIFAFEPMPGERPADAALKHFRQKLIEDPDRRVCIAINHDQFVAQQIDLKATEVS